MTKPDEKISNAIRATLERERELPAEGAPRVIVVAPDEIVIEAPAGRAYDLKRVISEVMSTPADSLRAGYEVTCDPADACATHGRCWTRSEWDGKAPDVLPADTANTIELYNMTEDPDRTEYRAGCPCSSCELVEAERLTAENRRAIAAGEQTNLAGAMAEVLRIPHGDVDYTKPRPTEDMLAGVFHRHPVPPAPEALRVISNGELAEREAGYRGLTHIRTTDGPRYIAPGSVAYMDGIDEAPEPAEPPPMTMSEALETWERFRGKRYDELTPEERRLRQQAKELTFAVRHMPQWNTVRDTRVRTEHYTSNGLAQSIAAAETPPKIERVLGTERQRGKMANFGYPPGIPWLRMRRRWYVRLWRWITRAEKREGARLMREWRAAWPEMAEYARHVGVTVDEERVKRLEVEAAQTPRSFRQMLGRTKRGPSAHIENVSTEGDIEAIAEYAPYTDAVKREGRPLSVGDDRVDAATWLQPRRYDVRPRWVQWLARTFRREFTNNRHFWIAAVIGTTIGLILRAVFL